jgi:hypothetical protein
MSNKFSFLESLILEKCTYTQVFFIYNLIDLFVPSTSVLPIKLLSLMSIKNLFEFTKQEFTKLNYTHYFNTVIMNLIKPANELTAIPIIQINLAMELYKHKVNRYTIFKYLPNDSLLLQALHLWFNYQDEEDIDKKKLLFTEVKRNNLLVTALHHEYKVMFDRFTSELYNLTRSTQYKHDPTRDTNIKILRKAIKNLVDNELTILEIHK